MKYGSLYIYATIIMSLPFYLQISVVKELRWLAAAVIFICINPGMFAKADALAIKLILSETISALDVSVNVVIPEMRWVLLPGGTNGACVSSTDCCQNIFCYGLEYTPGRTGVLTSYTTAFFADCVSADSPVLSNASCVMSDHSEEENGCLDFDLIKITCSGNSGTIAVTAGVPKIIHQVCFSVPQGMIVNVVEDEVTDLTTSIDLTGGGFVTEYPEYEQHTLEHAYLVTNTNDSGAGSFRNMVECALSGSTIHFAQGVMNQTVNLTSGVIDIDKDLTIEGLGMTSLVLSGNNSSAIFHILPEYDLMLKDIALKNAHAPTNGGAIYAQGNISLQNVLLQNNFENGIPKSMTITSTAVVEINGVVDIK